MSSFHKTTCLLAVSLAISLQGHGRESPSAAVAEAEAIYADLADSYGVISTIDSGLFRTYEAKDRAAWERVYGEKRKQLADKLSRTSAPGLSPLDARALDVMNRHLRDDFPEQFKDEGAPPEHCQDAQHQNLSMSSLEGALYACFTELGNNLEFEGRRVTRVSALGMLEEMSEEARRKKLFNAFEPLWNAVDGKHDAASPYRRLLPLVVPQQMDKERRSTPPRERSAYPPRKSSTGWSRFLTLGARSRAGKWSSPGTTSIAAEKPLGCSAR